MGVLPQPDLITYLADTVYGAAADCLQRALNLTNGCQPFLKVLNNNGGDLSLMTVFQVLEVRGLLSSALAGLRTSLSVICNKARSFFFASVRHRKQALTCKSGPCGCRWPKETAPPAFRESLLHLCSG